MVNSSSLETFITTTFCLPLIEIVLWSLVFEENYYLEGCHPSVTLTLLQNSLNYLSQYRTSVSNILVSVSISFVFFTISKRITLL